MRRAGRVHSRIIGALMSLIIWGDAAVARVPVVDDTLLADEHDGANWAAYGRTFSEQHFSPLSGINSGNVARLGLIWSLELSDVKQSVTTPLAVDGVLYLAPGFSAVRAVNASTGRLLWRFDPDVTLAAGKKLRTATNYGVRGLAFWKDKVFVGTTDGRLIALDAKTGRLLWSVLTVDPSNGASISGAPRVFAGKVIIGFGGGDYSTLRGYVTAYDAEHSVEPEDPKSERRRQSLPGFDRCTGCQYRYLSVALPDHARRHLGL